MSDQLQKINGSMTYPAPPLSWLFSISCHILQPFLSRLWWLILDNLLVIINISPWSSPSIRSVLQVIQSLYNGIKCRSAVTKEIEPRTSKTWSDKSHGNGVMMDPYAHSQHMKLPKHLWYVGFECGMTSGWVVWLIVPRSCWDPHQS